jgi:hypothetical protein
VRRRSRQQDVFPTPLQKFIESEWPPVEAECLTHYACRGRGYTEDCVPRPGEFCGQLCYESLARDYPDRPELLARAKLADAFERFHQARLNWLGKDHPLYMEEFLNATGTSPASSRSGRRPPRTWTRRGSTRRRCWTIWPRSGAAPRRCGTEGFPRAAVACSPGGWGGQPWSCPGRGLAARLTGGSPARFPSRAGLPVHRSLAGTPAAPLTGPRRDRLPGRLSLRWPEAGPLQHRSRAGPAARWMECRSRSRCLPRVPRPERGWR